MQVFDSLSKQLSVSSLRALSHRDGRLLLRVSRSIKHHDTNSKLPVQHLVDFDAVTKAFRVVDTSYLSPDIIAVTDSPSGIFSVSLRKAKKDEKPVISCTVLKHGVESNSFLFPPEIASTYSEGMVHYAPLFLANPLEFFFCDSLCWSKDEKKIAIVVEAPKPTKPSGECGIRLRLH